MLVEISRTSEMKFKDFKEPDLFSRTFQNWKMKKKIQGFSRTCGNHVKRK